MFVDVAEIWAQAGAGGAGAVAFRREKGVPRGGPSGGRGGDGGDVVLFADPGVATLLDYSYRQHVRAGSASHGEGNNRNGADGEDSRLPVPAGTLVSDAETGDRLGDLLAPGDELVVARGGRGGRGNASFAAPVNQAPRRWEPGEWGERRRIRLELKLIADVGLVGAPNAGKSTLLARMTAARPKIADYPFSTLTPNLGVTFLGPGRSFVVADIPGLIEGAHEGKGLGARFLRHIERTRVLALLVPADSKDPQAAFDMLREELVRHSAVLAALPHCVVVSKQDLASGEAEGGNLRAPGAWASHAVSAVTGEGVKELKEAFWSKLAEEPTPEPKPLPPRDGAGSTRVPPADSASLPPGGRQDGSPGAGVFDSLDEWAP